LSLILICGLTQKPQILRGYLIRLARGYTDGGMDRHAGSNKKENMHSLYTKANELSPLVIRCALEVYKHFGPGLLESIYTRCLARELELLGYRVQIEKRITITYKGFSFEEHLRFDLLVEDCLLVESKVSDMGIRPENRYQLLSYMSLLDVPLGLIFNFGDHRFGQRGIQRVILKGADAE
jgi:GxxExxY protein